MKTKTISTTFNDLINTLNSQNEDLIENEKEEWLTPTQISKELSMHINTIYRIIKSRQFPVYDLTVGKTGKQAYRIKRSDFNCWLYERRRKF